MYKLLIVDDEPLILTGIKQLIDFSVLSISEVFSATDGIQALEIVQDKHPNIVLADINMPNMDGLELAKRIKEIDKNTKVAIITGYDYFEYAISAIKTGVDDYLLKPVSKNDIFELLIKLVDQIKIDEANIEMAKAVENLTSMNSYAANSNLEYKDMILHYINEEFSNPRFSLKGLSEKLNLSQSYLSSLFKNIFGKPFQDYLISTRIERAKILILSTSLKIYEIALDVGFEDPNYFSTSFKKHTGSSPNEFRNSKRGDDQ